MNYRQCREADKRADVGPHAARPNTDDLKAVRTGIRAAMQALYSHVLREEIPDRIAELLTQFDQQKHADGA